MASQPARHRYCRCGTHLASDNPGLQCARCERASRDKLIAPPEVPAEFWQVEQFREAFAAQHMGRVARAYRLHPHHHAVYGPGGISQTLLGQWLGLRQPQVSQIETGASIRNLDTLAYWARVLRIPAELLWFLLPGEEGGLVVTEPAGSQLAVSPTNGVLELPAGPQSNGVQPSSDTGHTLTDDPEHDPVLVAPWSPRGTIEVAVVLRGGGGPVKRRRFVFLTGAMLTAPAHQWLVHEPELLVSGLSGRRISARLVDRLTAMVAELRRMDDVAGGGSVLAMAQHQFEWVAGLLDRASYDERTGRALYGALAELSQLCGWGAYDAGQQGLAQRYNIVALRAAHSVDERALGAHILGSMAKQAAHQGRPAEAATFAESALVGVRNHGTPRLLAELHIRRAYASATLHDRSACDEAISKACIQIEQFDSEDDPPWLYWVTPAWITVEAGDCLLRSEQADRAAAMLTEGVALFDESFARDRQLYTIHLIDALVRPGKQQDLDVAASRGLAAIQQAETLDSTLSVDLFRGLYRQMKPHGDVPAVRDFLEQAKGLVEGAGACRS